MPAFSLGPVKLFFNDWILLLRLLILNTEFWRRARSGVPKPASVYEEFGDSGRSERCL
jgi:hypothetical protein